MPRTLTRRPAGWRLRLDHGLATVRVDLPAGPRYRVHQPIPDAEPGAESWRESPVFIDRDRHAATPWRYSVHWSGGSPTGGALLVARVQTLDLAVARAAEALSARAAATAEEL